MISGVDKLRALLNSNTFEVVHECCGKFVHYTNYWQDFDTSAINCSMLLYACNEEGTSYLFDLGTVRYAFRLSEIDEITSKLERYLKLKAFL